MQMLTLVLTMLITLTLAACEKKPSPQPTTPTREQTRVVMTTFYPTTYFAQRIAGDRLTVINPVPHDADPSVWRPDDASLSAYQNADYIIINGAGFEKWVASAALPRTRIIDASANLPDSFLTYGTTTHSHGPEGEHTHEAFDGHTWLDPITAMAQVQEILRALKVAYPDDADTFSDNAEALMRDLAQLDTRLNELAPRLRKEAKLLASRPVYNYIARRYDLDITSLEIDPGSPIDQSVLTEIERITAANVKPSIIMLWEGDPISANVEILAAKNIRSIWFSPVKSHDPLMDDEYIVTMNRNLGRLTQTLN